MRVDANHLHALRQLKLNQHLRIHFISIVDDVERVANRGADRDRIVASERVI